MGSIHRFAGLGLATIGLLAAGGAGAQANPYYLGASQAFTRESNLFRAAKNQAETDDVISTTSLLAGIDQPIGRQRLFADGAIRHNIYQDNNQLNHTGYEADLGVDWETINRLSGTVSYSINENLARFGIDDGPQLTTRRNIERNQQFLARGRLGVATRFALETTYIHRERDYSASEFEFNDMNQDSLSFGVLYRPSGLLTLGAAVRTTRGEYPRALLTAPRKDEFDRDDLDLTADWTPTGLSKITARLSFSKEDHDQIQSRDFDGATGALSWQYKPTGKLTFITDLIRDTGSEGVFKSSDAATPVNVIGGTIVGSNSRVSTAVKLRALYEATAKVRFEGNARYVRRNLVNTAALPGGAFSSDSGNDRTSEFSLGVRYAPARAWLLACEIGHENRDTSSAASYAYSADTVGCSAQFMLR